MDELLKWYQLLSHSKSFKWAKFWGLVLAVLLAGLGYFWLNGHGFEALLILGLPIIFAASNSLESLSLAYQYSLLMQHLTMTRAQPHQITSETGETQKAEAEAEEDGAGEEETEAASPQRFELNDEIRLMLCQYYVFLYLLFELKITGEETHQRMVGLPARKYREWLRRLANSNLELVRSRQGKTVVNEEVDFALALERIATHDKLPALWDFPIAVYHDERNWRDYDPNFIWSGRTRLKVTVHKKRGEDDPPLLPIYPHALKDLNF